MQCRQGAHGVRDERRQPLWLDPSGPLGLDPGLPSAQPGLGVGAAVRRAGRVVDEGTRSQLWPQGQTPPHLRAGDARMGVSSMGSPPAE